jgi:hypothetical protein
MRLQQQLDAEADRHRERLAHERQLANLDEVRKVMDLVLQHVDAMRNAAMEMDMAAQKVRNEAATDQEIAENLWDDLLGAWNTENNKLIEFLGAYPMAMVRVGRDSPVMDVLGELVRTASDMARDYRPTKGTIPSQEWMDGLGVAERQYDHLTETLIERTHEIIEARPEAVPLRTNPHHS